MRKFRKLEPSDLPAIREIASDSFETLWSEKDFGYFIENPLAENLGVFEENKLIGYVLSLYVQGDLDVVSIAVTKEYRRQGVGKVLMNQLMQFAKPSRIFLEVESTNTQALSLYRTLGLEIYGLRKKYYGGVKDAVLMKAEKLPSVTAPA